MNKSELSQKLAIEAYIPLLQAEQVASLFFDTIVDGLLEGERAELRGFGSFHMRDYDGYTGRNPKTGAVIEVAPKRMPFFKVGRELKAMVDFGRVGEKAL